MLSLDLFDSKYERGLHEGAVDDLEQHRIDVLNDRMQDLLARAKESQYKNNPAALAGLKKEYQRFKDERDSYYKVREAGIPGNIPTEKIPGKEDLLKGKGRSYYESQKKNSESPLNQRLDRLKVQARREFPQVDSDQEALLLKLLDKEAQDDRLNRQTDARQDAELHKNFALDREQEDEIEDLQTQVGVKEHGGGIGPRRHWQDLMPEQTNPQDDDWYDDEEDQETDLRSGDYVRDTMDGELGEVFRMQGDPYERRVRILDREGKGWYIEPSRLTRVDPTDPDVQRYFGKNRVRDMDEAVDEKGALKSAQAAAKFIIRNLDDRAALKYYSQDFWSPEKFYQGATMAMRGAGVDEIVRHIVQDRPAQFESGVKETVEDVKAGMARIYGKLAPKIERYKDSFLAGQLYDELENYAELHGAEREFKQMMATARGRAHMEYDTNPGGFHNWFWFLPFEDENVSEVKADPTGSWVVYDGNKVKRFKTHSGAKAYAEKAGGKVASSEFYADRVQKSGMAEGWSDRMVAQRTGQPRTPYSVYIKGRKWKDFANDDLARAVMNKLKAKFKADGRDPETVTIAPTDMTEEALIEGIRDTAGATAVIACLLTGGSLSGCATAPQQTSAQQVLKTGQDIGRTVQTAKNITRAGVEAEVNQEIRNLLRGMGNRPEELNNSNILRIWRNIKGAPPVQPEPQAPEYGPADPVKRTSVRESNASGDAERAILNRIMVAHTDLLKQFGPAKVMQAAEEVAYNVGDVDEIGTSDVSGWVNQVRQILGSVQETKTRLDPKCWTGKKIGNPKTKMKGGVRVNNCVPK